MEPGPFSLQSNTESASYGEGDSSGQWSLPVGMNSSWSSMCQPAAASFSSFTSTDQRFTSSQTPFQHYEFQSLPNTVAPNSYSVQHGQVVPSGLSLGSRVIGYNAAENVLLHDNQTFATAADDTSCYREMPAVQWNQLTASAAAVAPIPEFVTSASYDGMFCEINTAMK